MKKSIRDAVYNKFGGRCAYSGTPLELDWQVDHVVSKRECWFLMIDPDRIENMVPAQKIINHYKRSLSVDKFRNNWLGGLHKRLAKLPANPRTERSKGRIRYLLKVASCFGITKHKPFSGVFYFETVGKCLNTKT